MSVMKPFMATAILIMMMMVTLTAATVTSVDIPPAPPVVDVDAAASIELRYTFNKSMLPTTSQRTFNLLDLSIWIVTNQTTQELIPADRVVPPSVSSHINIDVSQPYTITLQLVNESLTVAYTTFRYCTLQLMNATYVTTLGATVQSRSTIESPDNDSILSFGTRVYIGSTEYLYLRNITVMGVTNVLPINWNGNVLLQGNVRFDQGLNMESTGSRIQSTMVLVQDTGSNVVYAAPSSFRNVELVFTSESRVAGDLSMKDVWSASMHATARVVNEYQRADGTTGHSAWTLSTTPLIIGDAQCLDGLQSFISRDDDNTKYTYYGSPSITIAPPATDSAREYRRLFPLIAQGTSPTSGVNQTTNYMRVLTSPKVIKSDAPLPLNWDIQDTTQLQLANNLNWTGTISVTTPSVIPVRQMAKFVINANQTIQMVNASITNDPFTLSRVDGTLQMNTNSSWTLRNGALLLANGSTMVDSTIHLNQLVSSPDAVTQLIFGNDTRDAVTMVNGHITATKPDWGSAQLVVNGRVDIAADTSLVLDGPYMSLSTTRATMNNPASIHLPAGNASLVVLNGNLTLTGPIGFTCDAGNIGGIVINNDGDVYAQDPSVSLYGLQFTFLAFTLPQCIYRLNQPVVHDIHYRTSPTLSFLDIAGSTIIASNRISFTDSRSWYTISAGGTVTIIAPNGGLDMTNRLGYHQEKPERRGDQTVIFDRCTSFNFSGRDNEGLWYTHLIWKRIEQHDTSSGACATPTVANLNQLNQPATINIYEPITININGGGETDGNFTNHVRDATTGEIVRQLITIREPIDPRSTFVIYDEIGLRFNNWNIHLNASKISHKQGCPMILNNTMMTCVSLPCTFTPWIGDSGDKTPIIFLHGQSSYISRHTVGNASTDPYRGLSEVYVNFIVDPSSSIGIDGARLTAGVRGNGVIEMGPTSVTAISWVDGNSNNDRFTIKSLASSIGNVISSELQYVNLQLLGAHNLKSSGSMTDVTINFSAGDQSMTVKGSSTWQRVTITMDESCQHGCGIITEGYTYITPTPTPTPADVTMKSVTIDMSATPSAVFTIGAWTDMRMGNGTRVIGASSTTPISIAANGQLTVVDTFDCVGNIDVNGTLLVTIGARATVTGSVEIHRAASLTFLLDPRILSSPSSAASLVITNGVLQVNGSIRVTIPEYDVDANDIADRDYILATVDNGIIASMDFITTVPRGSIVIANTTVIYRPGPAPADSRLSGGAVAGIVIGVLVGVGALIFCIYRYTQRNIIKRGEGYRDIDSA